MSTSTQIFGSVGTCVYPSRVVSRATKVHKISENEAWEKNNENHVESLDMVGLTDTRCSSEFHEISLGEVFTNVVRKND